MIAIFMAGLLSLLMAVPSPASAQDCGGEIQNIRNQINQLSNQLPQLRREISVLSSEYNQKLIRFRQLQSYIYSRRNQYLQVHNAYRHVSLNLHNVNRDLRLLYSYPPTPQVNGRIQQLHMIRNNLMHQENQIRFDLNQFEIQLRPAMQDATVLKNELGPVYQELMGKIRTANDNHHLFGALIRNMQFYRTQAGQADCANRHLRELEQSNREQSEGLARLRDIQQRARNENDEAERLKRELEDFLVLLQNGGN